MIKIFNYILLFFLLFLNISLAEIVNVFEFTEKELSELKVRKVRGADSKTLYSLGENENGKFIRAEANNSASGLGKEIEINLNKTPFLNITWKIEKDLKGVVENSKKGHDYAARVFVVKKTISKSLLFFFIILNVVFPIEPVEPKIAIFFFI